MARWKLLIILEIIKWDLLNNKTLTTNQETIHNNHLLGIMSGTGIKIQINLRERFKSLVLAVQSIVNLLYLS